VHRFVARQPSSAALPRHRRAPNARFQEAIFPLGASFHYDFPPFHITPKGLFKHSIFCNYNIVCGLAAAGGGWWRLAAAGGGEKLSILADAARTKCA
jgi:hypothetical protein